MAYVQGIVWEQHWPFDNRGEGVAESLRIGCRR